jgi:putative (di)nucleoside polyphosphate hydrolase
VTPHWQFPQGGMKVGETVEDAVFREMLEELGTSNVRILGVLPRRTRYVWRGDGDGKSGFDGQMHTWFVLALCGEVEAEGESEEFAEFDWIEPTQILERTHPVRRATYQAVSRMFLEWLALRTGEGAASEGEGETS